MAQATHARHQQNSRTERAKNEIFRRRQPNQEIPIYALTLFLSIHEVRLLVMTDGLFDGPTFLEEAY